MRSRGSGASDRKGSSGPAVRATVRAASAMRVWRTFAASWNVLHSSNRAKQQIALFEAQQFLVDVDVLAAG